MAVNLTGTRTSSLLNDIDGDGQFDPGDVIVTRTRITTAPGTDAQGVTVTVTTNGLTVDPLDPEAVQVTPIAFDDLLPSITGNTPITFTAGQLLGNDIDPDGAEFALTISGVSAATNGAIVNNGNGTFTFTPTTGFVGTASFQYTITDEDGLASVSTGTVSFSVTDPVWYVDASYTGANGASDGSYLKPFTTLANLSTGGSADALDNADDTIFVYNSGTYSTGIVLETGQKLIGDGHVFIVNGLTIGANASNTTIGHAGIGVTLSTNNTILGVTLNGTANGAIGIDDGGAGVGTLFVDETSITGLGKAVDIDQGGTLNVDLDQLSSASSTTEGVHLQGVTGTFNATTGTIQSSTGTGILIGAAGGGTANSGGNVNFTYGGDISSPGGAVVEIQDRTGGSVTFSGVITEGTIAAGQTGILIDGSAGTINFNGQTFISAGAGAGNGASLTNNTGTINFAATGTGLDITTTSGTGLTFTGGGTLNITGAGNTVTTGTGQILNIQNGAMGTNGIAFQALASGNVAIGNAINIVNLDAAGAGTFSGGAVTIGGTAGVGADGISISGGSASTFGFASATIDNTAGDGIELNGANGAVTFTTVNLDGMTGTGISIIGATNTVTVSGGTIGSQNDPGGDGVNITNGTGAVSMAASVTKTSGGTEVIDISGHSGGSITFSGAITTTVGGGGIRVVNNTGGNIDFTGNTTLTTGSLTGITFNNTAATGANLIFSEGTLDLDTTTGTGISATNNNVTAGSLTISGSGNSIASVGGRAINIDGVPSNITLLDVSASGGTSTGVFLKNTGAGGQFVVTGTGSTAGSGGTIANISGADVGTIGGAAATGTGIYLQNVSNVALSNMIVGATGGTMSNFGIRGENVNNFTLTDSEFRGTFGDNIAMDEDAIRFGTGSLSTGLTGTAVFQGNNIQGGRENNLSVYVYGNNTLNLTVKDTAGGDAAVFGGNNTTNGGHSLTLESGGTSNVTLTVTGVNFNGANANLLNVSSTGSATQNLQITNNLFHNAQVTTLSGAGSIGIAGNLNNSSITYNIDGNSFKGALGSNIFAMFNGTSGTVAGIVNNNTFGTANGTVDSSQANYSSFDGGAFFGGIDSKATGTGILNYALRFSNNTVRDFGSSAVGGSGILLRSATDDAQGTGRLEATISGNTFAEVGVNAIAGIYAQPGGTGTPDSGKMGLNISANSFNFSGAFADGVFIDNGNSTNALVYLPGYAGPFAGVSNQISGYLVGKGNTFINAAASGTGGAFYNPGGTLTGANFVLAAPMAAVTQEAAGNGWQDLSVSPVAAPPRDPEINTGQHTQNLPIAAEVMVDPAGPAIGPIAPPDDLAGSGSSTVADRGVVSQSELTLIISAAIDRWIAAGATATQVEAMRAVQFGLVDMAGIYVGSSATGVIQIDNDAAGYGWFIDSTPGEDGEYIGSGTRLAAAVGGTAEGKIDLLTVVMHELGHQIGLDDEYIAAQSSDLMYGYANPGERRLPAHGEADGAVPGSVGSSAFAIAPISVGTIPAGKTVDIYIKSTISAQTDGIIVNPTNTTTISGSNFADVIINETITLDTLTLGNLVFLDVNQDGDYDAGTDTGIVGVTVDLFADTNDSGGWDAGDAFIGSTSTVAGGLYSFADLAPGDYVVVVQASNFNAGGALANLQVSSGTAADPDNNVENDNNGAAAAGGAVAAQTITLAYNSEPTAGTGNDVNNTVDFAFVQNTAPIVDLNGAAAGNDTTASYTEQAGAVKLAPSITLSDAESTTLTGATVTIASGFVAGDVLRGDGGPSGTNADGITFSYTASTGVLTLSGTATVAAYQAALAAVAFKSSSDDPGTARDITVTVTDGTASSAPAHVGLNVTPVNDAPVNMVPGAQSGSESAPLVFSSANGNALSVTDPDAGSAMVRVKLAADHGALTLSGSAGLTVTGDGTHLLVLVGSLAAINTALNGLTYQGDSGYTGSDTLTLTTNDLGNSGSGGALADKDSVAITLSPRPPITGDAGDNTLFGTQQADVFDLRQGGNDNASGLGDNDTFYFGAAFSSGDVVNGGAGTDQLVLQGNYPSNTGAVITIGAGQLAGIETLRLLSASDATFGGAGGTAAYSLRTSDANIASGQTLVVQADTLVANETLTFQAFLESNGSVQIFSGAGNDFVSGSQQADIISGGAGNDFIEGQGGADQFTGGAGNDRFHYLQTSQSTNAARDNITDFSTGDIIDFGGLAANTGGASFSFIGSGTQTGARQVQVIQNGSQATVNLFLDSDAAADLVIDVSVADSHTLTAADFSSVTVPSSAGQPMALRYDSQGLNNMAFIDIDNNRGQAWNGTYSYEAVDFAVPSLIMAEHMSSGSHFML